MADFVEIIHTNPAITTLVNFAEEWLVVIDDDFSLDDLLAYDNNQQRIFDSYTPADKETFTEGSKDLIRVPTKIRVPKENIAREIVSVAGNFEIPNTDFNAFLDSRISEMYLNEGYKPLVLSEDPTSSSFKGNAYKILNNVTVWIYSKALGKGNEGRLFNVTPFVQSVTTNVGAGGGNFSLSLAPITCEFDEKDGWVVTKDAMSEFFFKNKKNHVFRGSVLDNVDGQFKRKKFLLHHLISSNDLVFIQFESLEFEKDTRAIDEQSVLSPEILFPDKSDINKRIFDMIGLVDVSRMNYSPNSTAVNIEVSGRDVMKMLIDDGCYVYPIDYARGFDEGEDRQAVKRVLAKDLYFFKAFVDTPISYLITFLINQLSNVKVVRSDSLFEFYGDRRSFKYEIRKPDFEGLETKVPEVGALDDDSQKENVIQSNEQIEKSLAEGLWQIVKLVIDERIANKRVVDRTITDYQGSLLNYINKICQMPFVEFYGDTYVDEYYFIVRQPPYTKSAFLSNYDKTGRLSISEDHILEENIQFDDSEIYSWYRLKPQGSFIEQSLSDALVGDLTVFFEEYAEIWGAKAYEVVTNYTNIANTSNMDEVLEQMRQDLAYIIESNAYLPFTRKGTIKIRPDRRIKRGIVIKHEGTDELYHVDAVANSFDIQEGSTNRFTQLTVSRGMVEDFARGISPAGAENEISYFNIIDLAKDVTGKSIIGENFTVNKDVFDFFLKRKQFI